MKTLLYLTAFPPCQKTGGQAFSVNAVRELSQKYDITLMYFSYPGHECEIKAGGSIKSVQKLRVGRFDFVRRFWLHPIFTRRFNRTVLRRLRSVAANYDVIYFDFSQVALYSLYIKHPHKILRMHDVLCQKFSRKNALLAKWVCGTERKILSSVEKVFVPSQKDAAIVSETYGMNALYTNEYLKPVNFPPVLEQKNQFVFYGYWKRAENTEGLVWFIEKVLPLLHGSFDFAVMGGGLSSALQEKYLAPNGIRYLGFVDDPLLEIMQSAAVIVPLFQGAGIKVKVIDSFTAGTPVLGTELAFEGLPDIARLSHHAQTAQDFARVLETFTPLSYEEKISSAKEFDSIYNNHHLLEQIGGKI